MRVVAAQFYEGNGGHSSPFFKRPESRSRGIVSGTWGFPRVFVAYHSPSLQALPPLFRMPGWECFLFAQRRTILSCMRRRVGDGRRPGGGQRRIIASNAKRGPHELLLDDRPLALISSRDQKWVYAIVPYAICVLDFELRRVERVIELPHPKPSLWEDQDHQLWIGGHHLYIAHAFSGKAQKVGSKLAGWVDQIIGLDEEGLLFGVGSQGEILLERDTRKERFRRSAHHNGPFDLCALQDTRPLFCHGQRGAHIVDIHHLDGYTQLRLKDQDDWENPRQALSKCYRAPDCHPERVFLAAQDGAVAWTGPGLRLDASLYLAEPGPAPQPLALFADPRWLYVLRERGELCRYLLAPPKLKNKSKDPWSKGRVAKDPLPRAQRCRLGKIATTMNGRWEPAAPDSEDDAPRTELRFGAAKGQLGIVWSLKPESLEWENLTLGERLHSEAPVQSAPNFVATRHRFEGPRIQDFLEVDTLLNDAQGIWVSGSGSNSVLDRSIRSIAPCELMPQDSLVLAAMFRFAQGTARPGWVYWSAKGEQPSIRYFVWGDEPRQWIELITPELRRQKWERRSVFPMQVALSATGLEELSQQKDSRYDKLPSRWQDRELFAALAKECRKLLRVLW